MGVGAAPEIQSKLLSAGRAGATPVAIIENGSSDNERTLTGILGDLAGLVDRAGVKGPAIIIVGETASLAAAQPVEAVENFA
jgi:uroporphyrin-III C-methyltransferase/precorrin-2 dehydrogenase/sirohydrochlorin ferrochelatase